MALTILLTLAISSLCWSIGRQATLDLEREFVVSEIIRLNERYYVRGKEQDIYRMWLEWENERFKKELMRRGWKESKPF